jgi:nucleoid DNA-binding protein
MSDLKTKPTKASVSAFIDAIEDPQKRKDCRELVKMMSEVTGKKPKMWGTSIVGFGTYHYKYASGREGDWPITGFSPRKQNLTIYIMLGFSKYGSLMKKIGKHKHSKSCLYVRSLDDLDRKVLRRLVEKSVADMRRKYECD